MSSVYRCDSGQPVAPQRLPSSASRVNPLHIYIYIYIYVCPSLCLCVYLSMTLRQRAADGRQKLHLNASPDHSCD